MTSSLRSVRRRLWAVALVDEIGPLYAVYTLWFLDNGITAGEISTVFVLWALVVLALEIPSGALADRVDRRHLLVVGLCLRATGIAVWLVWPSFSGMLVGAALWGVHLSFASGAWEALVHDQLAALESEHRYAPVMARVGQATNLGVLVAAGSAAVALGAGASLEALGWVTVALHVVSITVVLSLPDVRWVQRSDRAVGDDEGDGDSWWTILRTGVAEAASSRAIGRLIAFGAVLEGLFVFDEYVAVLARERGASDQLVPVLVLSVWAGLLVGGELAARRPALRGRTLGLAMTAGAGTIGVALLIRDPWALLLIGVGYATLEAAWVLSDARLQERISHGRRATVTSVRSFSSALIAAAVFAVIGLLAEGDDPTRGMLPMAGVLLLAGLVGSRWIPDASGQQR